MDRQFLYLCYGYKCYNTYMNSIKVKSIFITNIEDAEKEIIVDNNFIKVPYTRMIKRSFRIDDDMLTNILDSGDAAIKVFRYIKSHTNSQTNKVNLKAQDIIEYLKYYNKKADASLVCKGIKKLCDIEFIIKANTLDIYKHEPSSIYLVNPNYYVVSSPDTVLRRIQSEEREEYDAKMILEANKQRYKREQDVLKLRLKIKNNESKN